jgi:hypothetical protein
MERWKAAGVQNVFIGKIFNGMTQNLQCFTAKGGICRRRLEGNTG